MDFNIIIFIVGIICGALGLRFYQEQIEQIELDSISYEIVIPVNNYQRREDAILEVLDDAHTYGEINMDDLSYIFNGVGDIIYNSREKPRL